MASVMRMIMPGILQSPAARTGSRYGVVSAIAGAGYYTVSAAGLSITAASRVGAVSVNDAVIVQQTGAGWLITSKIGMAEKTPDVVYI